MTKREAYQWGRDNGLSAAEDAPETDVIADRSNDRVCECQDRPDEEPQFCAECLTQSAGLAEDNARQYEGHYPHGLTDAQADAYDAGVAAGIKAGVKARLSQPATSTAPADGGAK